MYLTQYHRFASKHVTLANMSNAFLTVTVTVTAEFVVRLLQSARRCVRYIVSTRNLPPLDQIYSRVQRRKKNHTITRYCDQCCKGDTSSQWEKANLPLSLHTHPLTSSHQILHTQISPHTPYLVKIAAGVSSPHK